MAGKFNFIITADNNPALRAIRGINRELYKINKPFKDIAGSLRALSRESGFSQLQNAFKGTADAASDVASKIGSILTPLIAVTGFSSIAGVIAMGAHWSNFATQIKAVNYQTGMSYHDIQQWTSAGNAFGVTTETMTAALSGFGTTLEDAVMARNPAMLGLLTGPHFDIKNLKERLGDPGGVLMEVLKKASTLPPLARHEELGFMGLGGLEPMLMSGTGALDKMMAKVKELGMIMSDESVEAGYLFNLQMSITSKEVENLSNHIAVQLFPVLDPLIKKFDAWIQNDAADWLKRVIANINGFTDSVGGLNNVLTILGIILFRSVILEFINFARILTGMVITSIGFLTEGLAALTFTVLPRLGLVMVEMGAGLEVFGAAILATPIGWWIAGLAAVGIAVWGVYRAYQFLHRAKSEVDKQGSGNNSATGGYDINRALAMRDAGKMNPNAPPTGIAELTQKIFGVPAPDSAGIRLPGSANDGGYNYSTDPTVMNALKPAGSGGKTPVHVEVNVNNAIPGTTATVNGSPGANVQTNIHHALSLSLSP